ncbi:hypothetical protein C8Q75DRAFT_735794 [Abortiporus biennis]|nr:hypothetical protein C8Q75DRAFT_735794 [Abortiporus biennis]
MEQTWKDHFSLGVASFKAEKYEDAVSHFTKVIELGGNAHSVYDSRAAAYEKSGKVKEALRDSKMVVNLTPERWQGYARSARLFLSIGKYDAATTMIDMALQRLKDSESKRRPELLSLRDRISQSRDEAAELEHQRASQNFYHFGKIPLEIASTIFNFVLEENHAYVVRLAQVCKNWRSAVLNTPSFWSILCITNHNPKRKAKLWKARSKGKIEELQIHGFIPSLPLALEVLQDLSFDRLHSIVVDGAEAAVLRQSLPAIFSPQTFSNIRSMTIANVTAHSNEDLTSFWEHPMPNLENLKIIGIRVDWLHIIGHSTLLRNLQFKGPIGNTGFVDLLYFLKQNPRLKSLHFNPFVTSSLNRDEDRSELESVTAPSLEQLTVSRHFRWDFMGIVKMPCLQRLVIEQPKFTNIPYQHFVTVGIASKLVEFKLSMSYLDPVIASFLTSAAMLETLALTNIADKSINNIVETLSQTVGETSSPQTIVCPLLRHVDFSKCEYLMGGPVLRLVKAHLLSPPTNSNDCSSSGITSLKSLKLDGCLSIDSQALPWLRANVPMVSCVYMTKKQASWKR